MNLRKKLKQVKNYLVAQHVAFGAAFAVNPTVFVDQKNGKKVRGRSKGRCITVKLSKKKTLLLELEAARQRPAGEDDCQTCKAHFTCPLSREAHMKLYPAHFKESNGQNKD